RAAGLPSAAGHRRPRAVSDLPPPTSVRARPRAPARRTGGARRGHGPPVDMAARPRHAPRRRSRRVRRDVARCEPRVRDLRLRGAAAHPGAGDAQLYQPTRLHVSRVGELCDPVSRVLRDRAPRDADDARGHGRRGRPPMSAAPVPEGVRDGGVLRGYLDYLITAVATFLLMGLPEL